MAGSITWAQIRDFPGPPADAARDGFGPELFQKAVTGIALNMLAEEGKLKMDERVEAISSNTDFSFDFHDPGLAPVK